MWGKKNSTLKGQKNIINNNYVPRKHINTIYILFLLNIYVVSFLLIHISFLYNHKKKKLLA
jgi:hypothetical protein